MAWCIDKRIILPLVVIYKCKYTSGDTCVDSVLVSKVHQPIEYQCDTTGDCLKIPEFLLG
jgi:hypothetical protein